MSQRETWSSRHPGTGALLFLFGGILFGATGHGVIAFFCGIIFWGLLEDFCERP